MSRRTALCALFTRAQSATFESLAAVNTGAFGGETESSLARSAAGASAPIGDASRIEYSAGSTLELAVDEDGFLVRLASGHLVLAEATDKNGVIGADFTSGIIALASLAAREESRALSDARLLAVTLHGNGAKDLIALLDSEASRAVACQASCAKSGFTSVALTILVNNGVFLAAIGASFAVLGGTSGRNTSARRAVPLLATWAEAFLF